VQIADMNFRANQKSPEAAATLGYCLYQVGAVDDALKVLNAAVQGTGGQLSADTAYYLALCLRDKDKPEDAVKILDGALKAKGLFIYKSEAQALHDKLAKKDAAPAKSPAGH